ncbi:TPR repeat-containing protein [Richelia sinica FACHB-800]|uniref:TPR repeat-containing protein n=1 Tax=Richelia sinica FACHB-800 TaxID=1357546 RepID=A0A975T917_9NOST|nr:tetratricopeptide repeat protein [Richelia sinica]MBD2665015.1 tetratricopeptide repeat protein [Richelia sinica FACHB-800]QXE24340.1 TPR repeat-containing protein [Richelia sinica FACHB-800]
MLWRLILIVTTVIFWSGYSGWSLAESKKLDQLDKFPPSPLEINTPDPLLPPLADKQQLSLEDLQRLETALDELNQQASTALTEGNQDQAFEIWNRELRLRRYLGTIAELEALSRVGAIAWRENNRPQVQYITQRLQVIQGQMVKEKSTDLSLWRSLGQAYQAIRYPKLALTVYDQILVLVRQQQDQGGEVETLNTIGELHLAWFDYAKAGEAYEQLLNFATNSGDRLSQVTYLQQLGFIYTQSKQPQQTIDVLSKLVDIYTSDNNLTLIPSLKLAIASNYETLAQKDSNFRQEAFNNYQTAYVMAWESQQYVNAGAALQKLITLYRAQQQIDEALEASQILIETETLARNLYGVMQAYDQMGQLYLQRQEKPQALAAFQKGLEIAQQLKHEETYFTQQIEKLSTASF